MKSSRTRTGTARKEPSSSQQTRSSQGSEDRVSQIAVAAYYKAEARGFEPGHELEDWLSAEAEAQ